MNRRELLHPCGLLVVSLLLSGCGITQLEQNQQRTLDTALDKAVDVPALVKAHTPHVGDNSKVSAVLDALHLEVIGARTFEIHSDKQPYGLTVTFNTVGDPKSGEKANAAMKRRAVLALSQIENLERIMWTIPTKPAVSGSLTRAEAEKIAGARLTEFKDAARLGELATKLAKA